MRLLLTSDWQCSLGNLPQCEKTLEHLLSVMGYQKVDAIVHLGDVKEHFNPVDVRVVNFLVRTTEEIVKRCPFYVLLGNHDRISPGVNSDLSPAILPVMAGAGAITIENPAAHWLDDVMLCFVPYIRDPEQQRKAFSNFKGTAATYILFFHNEVRGSRLNLQVKSTAKLSLDDIGPHRFDYCFGGHIHLAQLLGENLWFVGSPFCQNWGEANQEKGFILLDTKRKSLTRIVSKLPGWYDPDLPNFPKPGMQDWTDCRIRIRVPIRRDAVAELAAARQSALIKYPGALIHLVSEFESIGGPEVPQVYDSDKDVLVQYFDAHPPSIDPVEKYLVFLKSRLGSLGYGISGLKILSAEIENILCFKKAKIDFSRPGLTLVTGINRDWDGRSNGSGKTSILSLPGLILGGKTLKGQEHDDWRTQDCEDASIGVLETVLADNRRMTVTRGRNPGLLTISVDGKIQDMGAARDSQRLIEQLTGITWEVLTNSIYVGQRDIAKVVTGTDKERKELFGRFLGLDRFFKAHEKINKEFLKLKLRVGSLEQEIHYAKEAIKSDEDHVRTLETGLVQEATGLVIEATQQIKDLDEQVKDISTKKSSLSKWLDEDQKKFEKSLDTTGKLEERLHATKDALEKSSAVGRQCPLCGSSVDRRSLEKYTQGLEDRITELDIQLTKWERWQSKNRNKRQIEIKKYQDLERTFLDNRHRRNSLDTTVAQLKEQVALRAKQMVVLEDQRSKLTLKQRQLEIHESCMEGLKLDLEFLKICLAAVSRDGIPSHLCAALCPKLNTTAARYAKLFSEDEITVRFSVVDGELDVQIVNRSGGASIQDQSEGELRLAGLIAIFAFRELLVPCNLLILDEPGEGLDAINAAVFADGLKKLLTRFKSVFVTTHNTHILGSLDADYHLEVVKQNRISEVYDRSATL